MKKLNFGSGIAIALVLFIGFILTLAITLIATKVDLQQENYYAEDLHYQSQIEAIENGHQLNLIDQLEINSDNLILSVSENSIDDAVLRLIRPNDEKQDQSFSFNGSNTLIIPLQILHEGIYEVQLQYTYNGKKSLEKKSIEIQ